MADWMALHSNHLDGGIPPELGQFAEYNLKINPFITLSGNQLMGPVPTELFQSEQLEVYLDWNRLHAESAEVSGDWLNTQTVAPTNIHVSESTLHSVTLSWDPILYAADTGRYRVWYGANSGGPYADGGATPDKTVGSHTVNGLTPGEKYYFVIRTETDNHEFNQNDLVSEPSPEISAQTVVDRPDDLFADGFEG